MYGRKRSMDNISAFITDVADIETPMTQVRPLLVEAFANLTTALTPVLGTPTRSEPGPEANIRWDLPKSVIVLSMSISAIHLDLKRPGYQAWIDEPEPEYED
jgi:hypothetical protein